MFETKQPKLLLLIKHHYLSPRLYIQHYELLAQSSVETVRLFKICKVKLSILQYFR